MHYHSMDQFAIYQIVDVKTNKEIMRGHKASFCLEDNKCSSGSPLYNCKNYGDQGISPSCVDIYLHNIDCQWIDITGLPPGMYKFRVS
jgi:lysyl oxidase-like protein 2/3/4